VLVIDDDPAAREIAERTIQQEGREVITAQNGRIGLERVAERRPSLIVLDLMMPEMDGFEFLRVLRNNAEWHDLPVVVLSAKVLTPEEHKLLQEHVQRVLQKGGSAREDLVAEVRRFVGQHATSQAKRRQLA
jgi:CheY-like chemotaxis protein